MLGPNTASSTWSVAVACSPAAASPTSSSFSDQSPRSSGSADTGRGQNGPGSTQKNPSDMVAVTALMSFSVSYRYTETEERGAEYPSECMTRL